MSHARTIWEEGREPGRQVVALAAALALTAAVVELALAERLGWGFDVLFVLLCLAMALLVAPRDFFTIGVLPPLLMLLVFTLVAVARRDAVGRADDSLVQAVIAGLAGHSLALCLGYGLCLGCLAVRRRYVS